MYILIITGWLYKYVAARNNYALVGVQPIRRRTAGNQKYFFDKRLRQFILGHEFTIMSIPIMYYLISGYDERVSLCYGRAQG